jgi:threonine dehydratase
VQIPDAPGSMASLAATISQEKANILEIHHNKEFAKTLGETFVDITVEVRGPSHLDKLFQALKQGGFDVHEDQF